MTRSSTSYTEGLRDGRQVFIDGEAVSDVTRHPAFRGAVSSIANLYDVARDPATRELVTFPSPRTGEPINRSYMIPASEADLIARRKGLRVLAEQTFGLMGRSPEHVASFLAGFAGGAAVFAEGGAEYGENVRRFHDLASHQDLYLTYTILPPQIDRSKPPHQQADPHLYAGVKEERDGGIVLAGAQMLGTGTALSDYVYLSSIAPLGPGDEAYAVAAMVPLSAPGLRVHARRSYAQSATSVFDYPLSTRFDESDSLVVFDNVFVPWEHVFAYRNLDVVRRQWVDTAAHALGNNQAQIRFWTKLDFLIGLAHRVARMNGSEKLPPVKGALGEMAAYAAMVGGLVYGQEQHCRIDDHNVAWPGPAEYSAGIVLQSEIYPKLLTMVRDLCGGGVIQLPSSVDDYANPAIAADLERYVQSPGYPSVERVKLLKMVWDMIGSEFASRHLQYEMFYAGAPFITKMRMYENFDFAAAEELVASAMAAYDLGGTHAPATPPDPSVAAMASVAGGE